MGKKVKSMRGEVIDFDVQGIKDQIASRPAPSTVKARQDFIDQKYRRRKKISDQIKNLDASKVDRKLAEEPTAQAEMVDEAVVEQAPEEKKAPAAKKRTVKRKTTTKTEDKTEE